MIVSNSKLGFGVYSIPDAARLVGVHSKRLRRWTSVDGGLVQSRFADPELISFLDLMELLFVKMFRDEDVSLQTIRKAAERAKDKFSTDYPFAVKRFDTDGKTIFATLMRDEDDAEAIEDLKHGQLVFKSIIRPFFKKLEYGNSDALRYWPQLKSGRVVLDPMRALGQPIDAETGVPTSALFQAVQAGDDEKTVAKWYDVPVSAVRKTVLFEKSL